MGDLIRLEDSDAYLDWAERMIVRRSYLAAEIEGQSPKPERLAELWREYKRLDRAIVKVLYRRAAR